MQGLGLINVAHRKAGLMEHRRLSLRLILNFCSTNVPDGMV
jgi:hypothetical protein